MTETEEKEATESYSRGDINRTELGDRVGHEVDFADALQMLWRYHLPLPHRRSDPQSPGVQLICQLASRAVAHA
ncbi:MAG: hypothetical protein HQL87_13045 [Magnetococcales bacterium]|nr:hypothetical protein [Magnetococcales bacterium]